MQEFFKTTIISKFIKYLLMVTPLPNLSYLQDYDVMVEGNFYLYHGYIYKCTKTGIFNGSGIIYKNFLYCSETVCCNDNLRVTDGVTDYGGKRLAEYDVIDTYREGQDIIGFTEIFDSTRGAYDTETHIKLGNYLRLLRSMYGLDLMSLYNCYCNYYVDNVDISKGRLQEDNNPYYKVTLIPVKFNKEYTIALNTSATIFMKPVIYDGRLIKNTDGKSFAYDNQYTQITKVASINSAHPIKLLISNTDPYAQSLEKHLYLAIQLPKQNNTSITVLEGVFNNYINNIDYDVRLFTHAIEADINKTFTSKSSLLANNKTSMFGVKKSIPFSDRLIEYLVGHTIDVREELSENVIRVTSSFGYKDGYEGSWEVSLRAKLYDAYIKLRDKKPDLNYEDILGYVDKDIEDALNRGYIKYGGKS